MVILGPAETTVRPLRRHNRAHPPAGDPTNTSSAQMPSTASGLSCRSPSVPADLESLGDHNLEPPLVDAIRIRVGMMRSRAKVVHSLHIVQLRLQDGKRVVFRAFSNAADHLPQIAALGEFQREPMPEICLEIGANALRDGWQLLGW